MVLLSFNTNIMSNYSLVFLCLCLTSLYHLRSYRDGAKFVSHATDTGHVTQLHHSIQTQDRPVAVLSTDVDRLPVMHNYPFVCFGSNPDREILPRLTRSEHSTFKEVHSISSHR